MGKPLRTGNRTFWCLWLASILGLSLLIEGSSWGDDVQPIIASIKVEGNRRIEESAIKFVLESKVGHAYLPARLSKDIRKIYELGYFKDVKVDVLENPSGVVLTYQVIEQPTLEKIVIMGNDKIKTADLEEKLGLKLHAVLNQQAVQEGIQTLKNHYREQGFYFAEVESTQKELVGNQVGLELRIKEGDKLKVEKIAFQGNRTFPAQKLAGVIQTKEKGLIASILGKDLYRDVLMRDDMMRLQIFYQDNGFIDIQVGEPILKLNKEAQKVSITIPLKEGPQYKIGKVTVKGDDVYTQQDLTGELKSLGGAIFSRSTLREDMQRITELYSQKGFAFADVEPLTEVHEASRKIDINFAVDKGQKMYVGQIYIQGNTKTRDKVVRREIPFKEGELYNSEYLKNSEDRLKQTGYFEEVKVATQRQSNENGLVDLEVKLTEKPTGNITFGGGFSTSASLLGQVGIEQNNLFGTGLKANLSGQLGGRRSRIVLGITQPYFMDLPVSAGFSLYDRFSEYPSFEANRMGSEVSMSKHLFEFFNASMGLKLEKVGLDEIDEYEIPVFEKGSDGKPTGVPKYILKGPLKGHQRVAFKSVLPSDQKENTSTSSVVASLSRNTLDNFLFPNYGSRITLSGELAGGLGDSSFYKGELDMNRFIPLSFLHSLFSYPLLQKLTLRLRGNFGIGGGLGKTGFGIKNDGLPIYERFFLGGDNNLRGYDFEDVGPKGQITRYRCETRDKGECTKYKTNPKTGKLETVTSSGDAIGGDYSALLSAEVYFPIPLTLPYVKALRGVGFFDMGDIFAKGDAKDFFNVFSYRKSMGVGVRVLTPMGPVRADIAYRLDEGEDRDEQDEEDEGSGRTKFHFGFGSTF
ncbi:MAG: outer membrane protein assembly factor BamA [Candidatus Tectomicrobia bacterium]|uniref:Outer membrane protein assembly factor BamA n=1 Tax=Tectimicrobiota bacterium TaxID=2528274 RepID=A0A932CP51_UNCTE|nr:outer membrane protein assembly factor BamA [Candidatus Tectomicrobia bacterium]